jgi:hypothetical protein
MIHSRYPLTSDSAVLDAQRGAALAKTIAAVGVLGGVLAIAVLASRDIQRPAEGRTRGDKTVPATVHFAVHVSPQTGVDDVGAGERSPKGSAATGQAPNGQSAGRAW